jgi:hypothetical protein
MKVLAIAMLYIFFSHPSIYIELWKGHMWLAIAAASLTVPVGTIECLRILLVRFSIDRSDFSLRVFRTTRRHLSDIANVERERGRVKITLLDGTVRNVPWLVGNLDRVFALLQSRGQA